MGVVSGKSERVVRMTEHEIQNDIRVELSQYGTVFRTNAGSFWQGKRIFVPSLHGWVLTNLQRVEGLPAGFSDLLFVDRQGAAFIEVKTSTGRKRTEQEHFIDVMRSYGQRAGFARSVEDALKIIKGD